MHRADADTQLFSRRYDALAGPQLSLNALFDSSGDLWPAKRGSRSLR
jgi:hypothetical protein